MSPFSALALLVAAPFQAPKSLADYLRAHPWNPAESGPLLVLEPEKARPQPPVSGMGSFGRRKVTLGGLTALVPPTRIDIDDSLVQKVNLYEGLPSDAKVLYLLRSLSDDQWRIAQTRGIGFSDLHGEQSLVFDSLLPKRFGWRANRLDKAGFWGEEAGGGTLNERERTGVRLRVERTVQMMVFFRDEPNSTSSWGTDRYHGAPGTLSYQRDKEGEYVRKSTYGVEVRKEVPNLPKPSGLDTRGAAFDSPIAVGAKATVAEILRQIGSRVGAEIVPDFRVADRTVVFYGGKASARDLLAALALCVEGTYRRVGSAYALTSDLEGMGARKLKLAQWEDRLQRDTEGRMQAWRGEIGGKGRYAQVGFGAEGPEVGSKAAQAIAEGDLKYGSATVDPSTLSPDLRRFLDQWDKEYTRQPIRKDKVGLSSELAYRYVLPDGRALDVEGGLGPAFLFQAAAQTPLPTYAQGLPSPPFAVAPNTRLSFRIAAESAAEATTAVGALARFPESELWLDTHSKAALAAALAAAGPLKLSVGLALRPWRANPGEPDRNVMGDFGTALRGRIGDPSPNRPLRVDLRSEIGTWMAPSDPGVEAVWRGYREMADLPGLAGLMLLETQPFGYEPERLEWMSRSQPLDWATLGHGYTVAQRLAFLRSEGVDPIDMGDGGYWTTPDLRQTYFFDDGLRGMPSVYDGTDDTNPKTRAVAALWRKRLAAANQAAIARLVATLGNRPMWIEPRLPNVNSLGAREAAIVPWKPGDALPTVGTEGRDGPPKGAYFEMRLDLAPLDEGYPLLKAVLSGVLGHGVPERAPRLLLDLDGVPSAKIDAVLHQWLRTP